MNKSNTQTWLSKFNKLALISLCSLLACSGPANADFSSLSVVPTRIVIEDGERSGSITLTNNGNSESGYRMKFSEMGLDSSGQFRVLTDDELSSDYPRASSFVRFSPRQIRLKPGESQVIRLIARGTSKMKEGEYRSHLNIQALPIVSGDVLQQLALGDGAVEIVSASTPTAVGISLPVIVRKGSPSVKLQTEKVRMTVSRDGTVERVSLLLGRSGNRSAYGTIRMQIPGSSDRSDFAYLRGYAAYHPYPREWVNLVLKRSVNVREFGKSPRIGVIFDSAESGRERGDKSLMSVTVKPEIVQ